MPQTHTAKLGDHDVGRIGFGAMQLAGPGVFGPPRDRDAALAVLRRAVALGVDHIDTSQYYGPDVVNALIRDALHPYPEGLRLVTKVGARRDDKGAWLPGTVAASSACSDTMSTRAGVASALKILCAPLGPRGKHTTSPASRTSSPLGVRTVGVPDRTNSHSSSTCS